MIKPNCDSHGPNISLGWKLQQQGLTLATVGKPRTQHIMYLENFISSETLRVYLTRKARQIIPF